MPYFNILSPLAVGIDADTFSEAAKRFVTMQRNLDITKIILADRFKNTMKADVAYTFRNDNVVAGISLTPTIYPSSVYPAMSYPMASSIVSPVNTLGMPLQPAGFVKTTSDGQQVFPVNKNNIAVGGVNANVLGVGGVGVGFAPTLAHGTTFMPYNNKNAKQ